MKQIATIFSTLFFLFASTAPVFAQRWYYPMNHYFERQTLKGFGQLIDDEFYKGKEILFPFNRFYGYHAGVDLEYLPGEKDKNVPVYAITTGKIKYIGELDGYGGVILQDIGVNRIALYGHVRIKKISHTVGEEVQSGAIITYLGDELSNETSKERKHLHSFKRCVYTIGKSKHYSY